jgi:AcrR family transcriptional regulator
MVNGTTTKERILDAALDLFSQKGYDAVTMEDIAEAVNIKKPSIYKHYSGKQDLFEAVFAECSKRFKAFEEGLTVAHSEGREQMLGGHLGPTAMYELSKMSLNGVRQLIRAVFDYTLDDPMNSRFRRMLVVNQFSDEKMANYYTLLFIDMQVRNAEGIIRYLTGAGVLQGANTQTMAMNLYGPVYMLINKCDASPEYRPHAYEMLDVHVGEFFRLYAPEAPEVFAVELGEGGLA